VVVIVADAIFKAGRRSGGLNTPEEPFGDQQRQGVIYRLQGDGANLRPDDLGDGVGRDVRLAGDRPQDRQSLGGDLNTAFTKEPC
jgi:hypothetical protein